MKKLPKFTSQYFIDLVFDRLMNILNSASNWCSIHFFLFCFESGWSILDYRPISRSSERIEIGRLNTLIKSRSLRSITMGLFLIAGIITTGIAIYAPATALSAVTSMNLDIAILSTGIVLVLNISWIV